MATDPADMHMALVAEVYDLLERKQHGQAVALVKQKNKQLLSQASWDLVPKISEFLTEENETDVPELIESCEHLFQLLVDASNPKELLLVLLEQLEASKNDVKLKAILKPVQTCLMSLPVKKGHSIAIALETIYGHIISLPTPEDQNLEGEERKFLDGDPCVQRINEVMSAMLSFLNPFVEEISWLKRGKAARIHSKKQITELTKYIVKMLAHPIAYVDLTRQTPDPCCDDETYNSTSRYIAEQLAELLSHLQPDLFKALLEMLDDNERIEKEHRRKYQRRESTAQSPDGAEEEEGEMEEKIPLLGLSVMCLLVFGENLVPASVPQVLHPQHILETCLPLVSAMLQQPDSLMRLKGVCLFSALVKRVKPSSLSGDMLEWAELQQAGEDSLQVMVTCNATDVRQAAVALLPLLLSRFDDSGRNKMIHHLLKSSHHSGINSYVIQLLKDEIHNMLSTGPINPHLVGSKLERLVEVVFALPSGVQSDLLEWSDMIMAALNFFRYLILRDEPQENVTGVWNFVPRIEKNYFGILRTALNMSRAHYNMELEKTRKGEYARRGSGEPEIDFTVGGQKMPSLSKEQQIQVLQTALHRFDMMESILARISDLLEQQQRKQASSST